MERIDKGYAIIYIDHEGETLKEDVDDNFTQEMITDYYNNSGALQWNFYVIIPKHLITVEPLVYDGQDVETNESRLERIEKKINEIESNHHYSRKYVIEKHWIENFIRATFPDKREKSGIVKLIKGHDWKDACNQTQTFIDDDHYRNDRRWKTQPSLYRDMNLFETLIELDKIRAKLITDSEYRLVYFTHISNEHNLADMKLHPFELK